MIFICYDVSQLWLRSLCFSSAYSTNPHDFALTLNLREYIAKCKWTERGGYVNGEFDPTETWDMCVHPLPLLTACGNDRGSGDYHEGYPDYNRVGKWAFDLIECSDKKPEGYEQLDVTFTERHTAA